jgi:ubiquinone/menaquinone biosynthesis C-methylase UbiE
VSNGHGFTLTGAPSRAAQEWRYVTQSQWSLEEVGAFWDSVTDYDETNEGTYSYFRRFTNSYGLAADLIKRHSVSLDIQSRTGYGTVFWAQRGFITKAHLADFSERMLGLATVRVAREPLDVETHLVRAFPLPFPDSKFDLVLSYETIEHISERASFVAELARVVRPAGWIILTCPNLLWEPVHSISAILNLHHSEGPHRFLRRGNLLRLFASNDLEIVRENSTVLLPFSSGLSVSANQSLERHLPESIKRRLALRRSFVLRKAEAGSASREARAL